MRKLFIVAAAMPTLSIFTIAAFLISASTVLRASNDDSTQSSAPRAMDEFSGASKSNRLAANKYPACGPASMAVALRILGVDFSNNEVAALADTSGDSTFAGLQAYAIGKGLYAAPLHVPPDKLMQLRHIAILQVLSQNIEKDGTREPHFIVFAGPVDPGPNSRASDGDQVLLYDPLGINGTQGPFSLRELSEFYTGNVLVLAREPIDLSELGDRSTNSIHKRIRWGIVIAGGLLGAFLGVAVARFFNNQNAVNARPTRRSGMSSLAIIGAGFSIAAICSFLSSHVAADDTPPSNTYVREPLKFNGSLVSKGQKIEHIFSLVNPTFQNITFEIGPRSCSCLSVRMDGPATVRPGEATKLILDVTAGHGGAEEVGVVIRVPEMNDKFVLSIAVRVVHDTVSVPEKVDFGDVAVGRGRQSLQLRIIHYSDNKQSCRDLKVVSSVPYITVTPASDASWKEVSKGSIEFAREFSVAIDPSKVPGGPIDQRLLVTATDGEKALEFTIPLRAQILPVISATPAEIVEMSPNVPATIHARIKLKSPAGGAVHVQTVEASDITVVSWRASESGDDFQTIEVILQCKLVSGRAQGTLHIGVPIPSTFQLDIPVKVIDSSAVAGASTRSTS